ncbi:hypothetical protein ENBRE01_2767 [Enteropsectra breve]|nr:hypothetical protein ENBRE01_2767 [Enteropsectra breve]
MEVTGCSDKWKEIQIKTFTKWMNSKLEKAGYEPMKDLFTDICTGVHLANLLEAIGKGPIKVNLNPITRISVLENVTLVLEHLKTLKIPLVNIGPADIVDGDHKLILGLVWIIISKLSMGDSAHGESYSIRDELLDWARRTTASYANVYIKNFTSSWKDGLAFNAVIHRFRPHLVPDYQNLVAENAAFNLEQSFSLAEMHLEIPRLLDTEDITDAINPEEKSIMTYVSQFYQKFKPEEEIIRKKYAAGEFLKAYDASLGYRNYYEKKAASFIQAKNRKEETIKQCRFVLDTLYELVANCEAENQKLIQDSVILAMLWNDITTIDKVNGIKPYVPRDEISIDKMNVEYYDIKNDVKLDALQQAVAEFSTSESKKVIELKDEMRDLLIGAADAAVNSKLTKIESLLQKASREFKSKKEIVECYQNVLETKLRQSDAHNQQEKRLKTALEYARTCFRVVDAKNMGTITSFDAKKIIKNAVGEEIELPDEGKFIGFAAIERIINESFSEKIVSSKLAKALSDLTVDGNLQIGEIAPHAILKNLKTDINGNITAEEIMEIIG